MNLPKYQWIYFHEIERNCKTKRRKHILLKIKMHHNTIFYYTTCFKRHSSFDHSLFGLAGLFGLYGKITKCLIFFHFLSLHYLVEIWEMRNWVLHLLTCEQKQKRVNYCQQLFKKCQSNKHFDDHGDSRWDRFKITT